MPPVGQGSIASAASNPAQALRLVNLTAVLQYAWDVDALPASDTRVATGPTRSPARARADDLVALGWVRALADARAAGERMKGRPARRYAFDPRAAYVVGVDAGQHRLTACVADLRGHVLARAERLPRGADEDPDARVRLAQEALDEALRSAGAQAPEILVTVVGIPAPADEHGRSPSGQGGYWTRMNANLADALEGGRTVVVDNDANLAAIAEASVGAGAGVRSFVALLSGERFGAGLIVDGTLLRGRHGGAGEMHLLDFVDGVGSASGLGALAREWAASAIASGHVPGRSAMRRRAPGAPELVDVVDAARDGEPAAVAVVERLAERLARISAVVAGLLDVELIVVCGAMAAAAGPVIERAVEQVPPYAHLPAPRVVASTLGADGVALGAVHRAVSLVRSDPLDFELPSARGRRAGTADAAAASS